MNNIKTDQGKVEEDNDSKTIEDANSDLEVPVTQMNDPNSSNASNCATNTSKDGKSADPTLCNAAKFRPKTNCLKVKDHHS